MSAPEDNLPPVQPPSASFLMQLFVVPMVIVLAIVAVSLMFNWLAHMGSKPEDLISELNRVNAGSWQKALTVANLLTDRRHAELRRNPQLAQKMSQLLETELTASSRDPERVQLRVYLTIALGVFEDPSGLPTLVRALSQQNDPVDVEVRKTALETFARQADRSPEDRARLQQHEPLVQALDVAARASANDVGSDEAANELRLRAAYTLGVIGGDRATSLLGNMTADADPLVRYNAASALARLGQAQAMPLLLEMLKIYAPANASAEPRLDPQTQLSVLDGAIRSLDTLATQNPQIDRQEVVQAIQRLLDDPQLPADLRTGVEVAARAAMLHLQTPPTSARHQDRHLVVRL